MSSYSIEILPPESGEDPNSEDFGLVHLILELDGDVNIEGCSPAAPSLPPIPRMSAQEPALWAGSIPGQYSPYWNPGSSQNFPAFTIPSQTTSYTSTASNTDMTRLAGHSSGPPAPSPVALSGTGRQHGGLGKQPQPASPLLQSSASRNYQKSASKDSKDGLQRRLPTPHPRSQHGLRGGTSERLAQLAASRVAKSTPKFSDKPSDTTKTSKVISRPSSLCAPKGDGRLARTTPPHSRRGQPEIVGRPLWSGNFAGANAPDKPPPAIRAAVLPRRTVTQSQLPSKPVSSGKDSSEVPAVSVQAPAAPPDGTLIKPAHTPQMQCNSHQATNNPPTVQYVNYNYRPVLIQSPQCTAAGSLGSDGDSTLLSKAVALAGRQRSTSTAEFLMHRE